MYAVVVGAYAAATGRRRLALSARNAIVACLGAALVASIVLFAALVRSDFSFVYVADHTSLELPTPYKLSAFWGGQEGSLLLWLLILTGYSTAAVLLARTCGRDADGVGGAGPRRGDRLLLAACSSRSRAHSSPRPPRPTAWG